MNSPVRGHRRQSALRRRSGDTCTFGGVCGGEFAVAEGVEKQLFGCRPGCPNGLPRRV